MKKTNCTVLLSSLGEEAIPFLKAAIELFQEYTSKDISEVLDTFFEEYTYSHDGRIYTVDELVFAAWYYQKAGIIYMNLFNLLCNYGERNFLEQDKTNRAQNRLDDLACTISDFFQMTSAKHLINELKKGYAAMLCGGGRSLPEHADIKQTFFYYKEIKNLVEALEACKKDIILIVAEHELKAA